MEKQNNIFFLPGWGFKSSIGHELNPDLINANFHNMDLPEIEKSNKHNSLAGVIDQLNSAIPVGAILMGWSLGGLLAMHLCANYPSKYKKCILVASSPKYLSSKSWPGIPLELAKKFKYNMKTNFQSAIKKFLMMVAFPNFYISDKLKEYLMEVDNNEGSLLNYLDILFKADIRAKYKLTSTEILHVLGDQDALIPIAIANKLIELNKNHSLKIIKGAGHGLFLTHQKQFIQTVNNFIG